MLSNFFKSFKGINKHVWILSGSMLINRIGSMVLLFMPLYLTNDLNFSMSQASVVMSIYGIGSILGSYVGGYLTDRRGFYNVLVYSLILSGILLLPLFFTTNFYLICIIVLFYSMAADSFRPANTVAVSQYSTDDNRTRSISLIRLAVNLGFGIGPALGGFMAHWVGYKYIFLYDAVTSIIAGLFIWIYLPKKDGHRKKEDRQVPSKESSVFYDYKYLFFLLLVALYGSMFFQLFSSAPLYFNKDFHFSEEVIGYLLALNGLLVVVLEMPIIARIENKHNGSTWIAIGCINMFIAYVLLGLNYNSIVLCVVYTFFITLSETFAMPFMMQYAMNKPSKERQGQYTAMYSIAYGISLIVAPLIGLNFSERYGFPAFYWFAAVLSLFIGFIFYKFIRVR